MNFEIKYVVSHLRNNQVIDHVDCLTLSQAMQIRDEWAAASSLFDSFNIQEVRI
jgi:hypothetical protein